MADFEEIQATDALLDALGAGRRVDDRDPVAAPLSALAALAQEPPAPEQAAARVPAAATTAGPARAQQAASRGLATVVDRRFALRSLAAAVAVMGVVSTGGISAAVTGDPLYPVRTLIDQMAPGERGKIPSREGSSIDPEATAELTQSLGSHSHESHSLESQRGEGRDREPVLVRPTNMVNRSVPDALWQPTGDSAPPTTASTPDDMSAAVDSGRAETVSRRQAARPDGADASAPTQADGREAGEPTPSEAPAAQDGDAGADRPQEPADATTQHDGQTAGGEDSMATGEDTTAKGSTATGEGSTATGEGSTATGTAPVDRRTTAAAPQGGQDAANGSSGDPVASPRPSPSPSKTPSSVPSSVPSAEPTQAPANPPSNPPANPPSNSSSNSSSNSPSPKATPSDPGPPETALPSPASPTASQATGVPPHPNSSPVATQPPSSAPPTATAGQAAESEQAQGETP